jgi:ABC-type transport system involved in cytochrome bd biosynthesis fused ATPase/permease subunit
MSNTFSASLFSRFNLCPDGSKEDTDIWNVLEKVELKNTIENFPGRLGKY